MKVRVEISEDEFETVTDTKDFDSWSEMMDWLLFKYERGTIKRQLRIIEV